MYVDLGFCGVDIPEIILRNFLSVEDQCGHAGAYNDFYVPEAVFLHPFSEDDCVCEFLDLLRLCVSLRNEVSCHKLLIV